MKVEAAVDKNRKSAFDVGGVLVALELGQTDDSILNYLKFLTETFTVRETAILHVIPKITLFDTALEFDTDPDILGDYKLNEEVIAEMRAEMLQRFSGESRMDIVFDVKEGEPLEGLLKEADILDPDLIMIGQNTDATSHGILAKNLVRKVKCNAWVVPKNAEPKIQKILVPLDFSPYSVQALKKAVAMAAAMEEKVEIIALNVYDMPNFSTYKISRSPEKFKAMMHANREEGAGNFIQSIVKDSDVDVKVKLIERKGPGTGHYIMDYAKHNDVDLIVMGAKGHSKVELLLLGSVTEKVLSLDEKIPVLVVK